MSGTKSAASLVAAVVVAGGLAILLPAQAFAQFSIPIPFGPGGLRFEPYRNRAPSHHVSKSHSEDSSPADKSDKSKERDATEVDANGNGGHPSQANTAPHSEESSAPVRPSGSGSGSGSGGGKSYDQQPSFAPSR